MADGWAHGGGVSHRSRGRSTVMQVGGVGLIVVVLGVVAVQALQSCTAFDFEIGPGTGDRSQHLAVGVAPRTDLRPGQKVRVSSAAFEANGMVVVTVCLREADTRLQGVDACDTVQGSQFDTDSRGRLAATYRVPRVINVAGRAYDCASRADRCLLVAADREDYDNSGGEPLRFRTGLPPANLAAGVDLQRSAPAPITVRR